LHGITILFIFDILVKEFLILSKTTKRNKAKQKNKDLGLTKKHADYEERKEGGLWIGQAHKARKRQAFANFKNPYQLQTIAYDHLFLSQ
jgi:hypothetical protein